MVITLQGNVNHTYHQALRAAYDKGKAEGRLDEQTIVECEAVFSREKYVMPDDGVDTNISGWRGYQKSGLQEGYEDAMENARKRHGLPSLENTPGVKEVLDSGNPDLAQKSSGFSSDNKDNLKALFASVGLSIKHQQMLTRMFNIFSLRASTLERTEIDADSDRKNDNRLANGVGLDMNATDQWQMARKS